MLTREQVNEKIESKIKEARSFLNISNLSDDLNERNEATKRGLDALVWVDALEWAREELLKENG